MPAILFGSIGTLADTSELQRQSFNDAFRQHGLAWNWSRDDYVEMLRASGGRNRIAEFAASQGEEVDAAAVHETKTDIFQQMLTETKLTPRPGVTETIHQARAKGYPVALVTTTTPENVAVMLSALAPNVEPGDLDIVLDADAVTTPKPDKAAYTLAIERLGILAGDAIAIEDNVGGVAAATAAGVTCVAFPNENTAGHDFDGAAAILDRVDLSTLEELAPR